MLKIEDLTFRYKKNGKTILDGVSLELKAGEIGIVLGRNGSGKTTLFSNLLGIHKPMSGKMLFQGEDLGAMSPQKRAEKIAYVPQHIHFGQLSVFDAVLMSRVSSFGTRAGREDYDVVKEILKEMGLEEYADRNAEELSGGEKQKIAIARALAQRPDLLILDEPTGNLDLANEQLIIGEAKKLSVAKGISILSSLHDLNQAMDMGDRFFLMKDGKIKYSGGPEIFSSEIIKDIFDVNVHIVEVDGKKIILTGKEFG
ncbi:MAG: ABC transporter ATP-binding protein [Lachnospiraceae bacterium]|nr:ABC transporter ATP-binding protein [Lachnospiraceae bacterium]